MFFDRKVQVATAALAFAVLSTGSVIAQPYTYLLSYSNNTGVPTNPPGAPGAAFVTLYVARGGNGVPAIAEADRGSVGGANVRLYYVATALTGNPAGAVSTANGARPTTSGPTAAGPFAEALPTDSDQIPETLNYMRLNANFEAKPNQASGNAALDDNALQLPQTWTYANKNHAAGTFEALYTWSVNINNVANARFGITPQPTTGGVTNVNNTTGALTSVPVTTNATNGANATLSVDLTSLTASVAGSTATISWSTAAEYDNAGFVVYREENGDLGEAISTLVAAEGSASSGASYSVVDPAAVAPGETRSYYLADIDLSGATTVHGPVSVTRGAASSVSGWELY
jgi:hypothetical protein